MRRDAMRRLEIFSRHRDLGLSVAAIAREMGVTLSGAEHYAANYRRQVREGLMDAPIVWPVPSSPVPGVAHWTGKAACRGQQDLFFAPEGFESERAKAVREAQARSLCAACPVQAQCGDYAQQHRAAYGVWAGMSEEDRENEREERVA